MTNNSLCFSPEFLQRCRNITTYYEKKWGTWTTKDQILKIYEEVVEVQKAQISRDLLEETCDVILASITMFDILGVPFVRVQEIMDSTLQKVEERVKQRESSEN